MSMEDQINLIYKHFLSSEGISIDSRKIKIDTTEKKIIVIN